MAATRRGNSTYSYCFDDDHDILSDCELGGRVSASGLSCVSQWLSGTKTPENEDRHLGPAPHLKSESSERM
jgi:hypothetical protein